MESETRAWRKEIVKQDAKSRRWIYNVSNSRAARSAASDENWQRISLQRKSSKYQNTLAKSCETLLFRAIVKQSLYATVAIFRETCVYWNFLIVPRGCKDAHLRCQVHFALKIDGLNYFYKSVIRFIEAYGEDSVVKATARYSCF